MKHSEPNSFGTKSDVFYALTTSGWGSSLPPGPDVRPMVFGEPAHQSFVIRRMLMDGAACFWRLHALEVVDPNGEIVGRLPLQGAGALTAFTMLGGPSLNLFVQKGCRVRVIVENVDCASHGFSLVLQGEHDSRDDP